MPLTRVMITGARAPAALHLARLLHGAGHHVVMADSLQHTLAPHSRACAAYVLLPAANGDPDVYGDAIVQAIAQHQIGLVIPTCEEVFYLAALWQSRVMDAALCAPGLHMLTQVHDKYAFIQLAKSFGLSVPQTDRLTCAADLDRFRARSTELVFKPVWSRFATQVLIKPRSVQIVPTPDTPWVAQAFVAGQEISVYAFAHGGCIAGIAAYRSLYRAGKGAGIAFVRDDDPAIADLVRRFVDCTGWSGQIAFDLIRGADGGLTVLECNPRSTSGVHFFRRSDAFAQAFLSAGTVNPDVTGLQAVKSALWLYGPWQKPMAFWRDIARAADVMAWPEDPVQFRHQLAATWEIMRIARRERLALTAATTHDIAWDGAPFTGRTSA